jgi:hypothetical protein
MHSRLGRDRSSYPDSTMDIARDLSHYRSAEAIVSQAAESSALGYVCYGMAVTADWGVWTDDGLAAAERAMDIAVRLGNDRLRRHAASQRRCHLIAGGRLADGLAELEATWHEADQIPFAGALVPLAFPAPLPGGFGLVSATTSSLVLHSTVDPGRRRTSTTRG